MSEEVISAIRGAIDEGLMSKELIGAICNAIDERKRLLRQRALGTTVDYIVRTINGIASGYDSTPLDEILIPAAHRSSGKPLGIRYRLTCDGGYDGVEIMICDTCDQQVMIDFCGNVQGLSDCKLLLSAEARKRIYNWGKERFNRLPQ